MVLCIQVTDNPKTWSPEMKQQQQPPPPSKQKSTQNQNVANLFFFVAEEC